MKKTFLRFIALTVAAGLTVSLMGCSGSSGTAQAPKTDAKAATTAQTTQAPAAEPKKDAIKVSIQHVNSNQSTWEKGLTKMVDMVNADSKGKFKMELFGNGVLCQKNPKIMIEMLQSGSGQMAMESVTSLVSIVPELFGINMPFIFQDPDHLKRFIDANPSILQKWKKKFEEKNLMVVGMIPRDFRQLTNKVKIIKTPGDIKNMKFRVPNNPWYVKTFEAFGAKPVPIASSEIYSSIQLGTVFGEDNSIPVVYDWKFYEVEKNMTIWNYMGDGTIVFANKAFWDGLSEEDRNLYKKAAMVAGEEVIKLDVEYAKDAKKKMEAAGVKFYEMSENEKEPFKKLVKPVYDEFEKQIGSEDWKSFMDAVEKTKK